MPELVSRRIALLRFVMIVGVVVLHTPQYVPLAALGNGGFDLFKAFFQSAFFRASVPVLTVVSGYLLFHSGLDQVPLKLYRRKFYTLGVPFLCFNVMLLTIAYFAERHYSLHLPRDLSRLSFSQWLDAALGLTNMPFNYPLNFMRDLIALTIAAPIFGLAIRRFPVLGLLFVSIFFMDEYDGAFVLRSSMAVLFYIGGLAAVYKWNVLALDRYAVPCMATMIALCCTVLYLRVSDTTVLTLMSPFLIWPAASLVMGWSWARRLERMSKYSLFIFVAHAPLLAFSWILFQQYKQFLSYPAYWLVTPFMVVGLLILIHKSVTRVFPVSFGLILGNRARPTNAQRASAQPAVLSQ